MNGTGIKGGAFGFKISSINKVRFDCMLELFSIYKSNTIAFLAGGYQVSQ